MRGTTSLSRESLLQDFVTWSAAHITGDEKGQAQIFLDRLFCAFGQKGSVKLKAALDPAQLVNQRKLKALKPVVPPEEIRVFSYERY